MIKKLAEGSGMEGSFVREGNQRLIYPVFAPSTHLSGEGGGNSAIDKSNPSCIV